MSFTPCPHQHICAEGEGQLIRSLEELHLVSLVHKNGEDIKRSLENVLFLFLAPSTQLGGCGGTVACVHSRYIVRTAAAERKTVPCISVPITPPGGEPEKGKPCSVYIC